jgi:hypothetical protein
LASRAYGTWYGSQKGVLPYRNIIERAFNFEKTANEGPAHDFISYLHRCGSKTALEVGFEESFQICYGKRKEKDC